MVLETGVSRNMWGRRVGWIVQSLFTCLFWLLDFRRNVGNCPRIYTSALQLSSQKGTRGAWWGVASSDGAFNGCYVAKFKYCTRHLVRTNESSPISERGGGVYAQGNCGITTAYLLVGNTAIARRDRLTFASVVLISGFDAMTRAVIRISDDDKGPMLQPEGSRPGISIQSRGDGLCNSFDSSTPILHWLAEGSLNKPRSIHRVHDNRMKEKRMDSRSGIFSAYSEVPLQILWVIVYSTSDGGGSVRLVVRWEDANHRIPRPSWIHLHLHVLKCAGTNPCRFFSSYLPLIRFRSDVAIVAAISRSAPGQKGCWLLLLLLFYAYYICLILSVRWSHGCQVKPSALGE